MNIAAMIAAASVLLGACAATAATAPVAPPQAIDPMIRDGVIVARLSIPDGDQPAIEAGFWVPTDEAAEPRPLIIISHGNGGDFRSHHDTAAALAKAGFVVVALTHTGDNWRDQSRATDLVGRTRQLSVVIDYMTRDWSARAGIDDDGEPQRDEDRHAPPCRETLQQDGQDRQRATRAEHGETDPFRKA